MKGASLTRRPGRSLEWLIVGALAAGSIAFGASYAVGLVFLLVRGGWKITSFTLHPTPLWGVSGEVAMRVAVGLALFGAMAWAVHRAVVAIAERGRGLDRRPRRALGLLLTGVTVVLAVLTRDHLPRFLIMLPLETEAGGGVGPEIFNTVYFALLSTAVTLPIGIGAAVYLARFARSAPLVGALRTALDTLASLPSIVYGLFGFLVFVVQMRAGYSLAAGAFVLALLNLPLVVGIAEEALRAVPRELEEASLALGATRVQTVFRVSLPVAWPGILAALVLGIGRVFAESAPLIMTAGTTISRASAYSPSPFRGGETLAVHLWYVNSVGLAPDRAEISAGTAAILVVLVALTNALAARLGRVGRGGARLRRATRL